MEETSTASGTCSALHLCLCELRPNNALASEQLAWTPAEEKGYPVSVGKPEKSVVALWSLLLTSHFFPPSLFFSSLDLLIDIIGKMDYFWPWSKRLERKEDWPSNRDGRAWGNSNTCLHTFKTFYSNWKILPLPQTGHQVNVDVFFSNNKLKNSNPQPIFYFAQLLFPRLYMSIFTSSTTSWIIYFPWSISLSEKSLHLGIWQFVADIHLY